MAYGQIVINEFCVDDTSADQYDFVELYNAGASAVDLSGYKILGGDNNIDSTNVIPSSTTLAAGDYYVIGMAGVPNVDFVITTDWESNLDWLTLTDPSDNILDSVCFERQKDNVLILAGHAEPPSDGVTLPAGNAGGVWSNYQVVESDAVNGNPRDQDGNPNTSITLARLTDGYDTNDNNNDFGYNIATPGEANHTYGTVDVSLGYMNDFDGAEDTIFIDIPGPYSGSSQFQNPAAADVNANGCNPSVIASSPQGGNYLSLYYTSSYCGSILNMMEPVSDVGIECYVYLDATPEGTGLYETTAFMTVRGREAVPWAEIENADGIRWVYHNNDTAATLTLEEIHRGVATQTFTTIPIVPGSNDGWQRLGLQVQGTDVVGVFGGTVGDGRSSGTLVSGTTPVTRAAGVGFAYHCATESPQPIGVRFPSTLSGCRPISAWSPPASSSGRNTNRIERASIAVA
jgi:hypothetical protein